LRKSRKTLGLDAEYAELLRELARKRGMSTAAYLRKLVEEAAKLEEMGYFAPRALSERRVELVLSKLGFTISVPELIAGNASDEEVVNRGVSIGRALVEIGVDPAEVVELIGLSNQLVVARGDNVVMLPQHDPYKQKLALLLKGLAKGAGLNTVDSGGVTVILLGKRSLL